MRPRPPPNVIPLILAAGAVLLTLSGRVRAGHCRLSPDCGAEQLQSKQAIYKNGLGVLGEDLMNALPPDNGTRIISWADGCKCYSLPRILCPTWELC